MPSMGGCWGKGTDAETEIRTVLVNCGEPHRHYKKNNTSTTKYNLVTFFPRALFEQYRRVANVYFTVMAALSLTPYSPVRAWTTWLPLGIVLGVSMIKEAIEDYKRYKQDKEINNRSVDVLDPATRQYVTRTWKDVHVGDIVRVRKDDQFPADVVFLTSETEEGTCYIETMNLDGETNLKIKKAMDQTKDFAGEVSKDGGPTLFDYKATVKCEGPNARLYQFTGNLEMQGPDGQTEIIPLNPASVILRGCSLRNTHVCYGAVIYAGHETKVFMNSTEAPSKRSALERIVDKIIFFMFALLGAFCVCGAVYFSRWTKDHMPKAWYLDPSDTEDQYNPAKPEFVGGASFITSFILYGYLIPISLYVTMEVVKIVQSMVFINLDRDMYHAETDTPALARTSNLNEELGMVNTILSDKTGTLTRNVMEFFKCSIAGVSYGAGITEIERANAARRGVVLPEEDTTATAKFREHFFNFYDSRLMGSAWQAEKDPVTIEMFFRLLAVCHTVVPDGPTTPHEIKYEAESPDEAALVVAAKVFGFFFFKRTNTSVTVRETGRDNVSRDREYELLNILEFNSTRKRMSVIVRDPDGKIIIFCKGADTVIYERLDPSWPANEAMKAVTAQHMEDYGSAGLRTLCLSYTEVDPDFYNTWQAKFVEAKTSLQGRDEKLAEVSEEIERNLRLLGCTAIEDKLQEGVPDCIAQLAKAGIRIWVLTGDKMETAINIGFACSLLTENMHQSIITAYSKETDELEAKGDKQGADKLCNELVGLQLQQVEDKMAEHKDKGLVMQYAIIIDGKALSYAMSSRLRQQFLRLGLACKAVICCRVSPLQKAQVTELVRNHGDTTLAIGDGANDVGMIQKAHIGVGISGQEGMQAVMAADFAIAQFRYLRYLLLVHGRYSYKRLSRMVLFFFYKNMLFGVTLFAYNAFNAFSGQYIYNDFYMTLYNVVFTALTPAVIGMFDRDVDKHMALKYPGLYMQGQRNEYFNFRAIALWLLSSMYQCALIMVFVLVGCSPTTSDRAGGQPYTMWQTGVVMYSIIIITVHLQVIQTTEQWTWLHHVSIWLSQLVWWLYLMIFGAFPFSLSADLYDLFIGIVAGSAQYWFFILMTPLAAQLPDFFLRNVQRQLAPFDHQIVQEVQLRQQREGGKVADENGQKEPSILQTIFASKPNKNRGFVPPYDPRSKFYGLVSSGARATGQIETGVRNPVLNHLDEELTNNPYRNKKKMVLPSLKPKGSIGSINGSGEVAGVMAAGSAASAVGVPTAGASVASLQYQQHQQASLASLSGPLPPLPIHPAAAVAAAAAVSPAVGAAMLPMMSNSSDAPAMQSVPIKTSSRELAPAPPRTNRLPPIQGGGMPSPLPVGIIAAPSPGAIASPGADGTRPPLPLPEGGNPLDKVDVMSVRKPPSNGSGAPH